jgi:SRSO17 transposase
MTPKQMAKLDRELREYIESMTEDMGRPERRQAMSLYMTGLLLDGDRKSIEPMAARLVEDERQIPAMRQRLQQCVVTSPWSDAEMYGRLARKLERELPGIEAFVIDDTGFPKKGTHSVGVQRQYSGTLGRTDNCQVATSLHLASERGSSCIGLRLYLPEVWTEDRARCRTVGIPAEVGFLRKWQIALQQIDDALSWGVRQHVVLADAGYGDAAEFRDGLSARGLAYLVGVQGTHLIWPPGSHPRRPVRIPGVRGRPKTVHRDGEHKPLSISSFAAGLSRADFRKVTWRQGSRGRMSSRFAFVRIHAAERHGKRRPPSEEQWLICEWPRDQEKPTKYYLSTMPATTSHRELVRFAKLRWRIERDYQELKQEIGLDHFEGRMWRGFHHHATLCSVAHAFLALRRALSPPEADAVDLADRPSPSSTRAAVPRRRLSTMQTTHRRLDTSTRSVADVIR